MSEKRRTGLGRHLAVAHNDSVGKTLPDRAKDCYRQAFLFVQKYGDGGWELVHGELTGWAIRINGFEGQYHHAWAEKDGMLYEPLHDLVYERDFYAGFAEPVEIARYSKRIAARKALETGHYGAWEGPHAPD